jgi:Ser/Thr protein kinase RdoA (MazF antagonist)
LTPFDRLTEVGQARRLRTLVSAALDHYGLDVMRIRLLARETNTLFRIDLGDGSKLVMRVADPQGNTFANMEVEVGWLVDLRRSGLPVPQPIRAVDGRGVVRAGAPGVPEERDCVLFGWVPGRPLGSAATAADYSGLGELSARLHQSTEQIPTPVSARHWDRVLYYPEDLDPMVVGLERYSHLFTPHRRSLIDQVLEIAEPALSRLHSGWGQLVHGDLHPWNVHGHRGELWALDFEDAMVAAPIQDIAISLFYNRDRPDHPDLVAAFRAGYETVRAWPDEEPSVIPTVMAARTVMFMNYVAHDPEDAEPFLQRATSRLEAFVAAPGVIPLML